MLEVNKDKIDTEIPAPAGGAVLKLYIQEGETVQAGTLLAVIGEPGEVIPDAPKIEVETVDKESASVIMPGFSGEPEDERESKLGFISPVEARIAAEHNVDLSLVQGTGQGGRITKKDVLAFLDEDRAAVLPWEQPASGEVFRPTDEVFTSVRPPSELPSVESTMEAGSLVQLDVVRQKIAEHMVRSRKTSPHVTTLMEVDLGKIVAHREENKAIFARQYVNLTFSAYFASAAVEALKAIPIVNSSWTQGGIKLHREVNLGMAVSMGEKCLIVPVIRGADQLSLLALARAIHDLAQRARAHKLQPEEVQNGTFTITNHGVGGSLLTTPIINQPQCAILGVGAIQTRVVVMSAPDPVGGVMDAMAIRPMVYLTLTFDHRILDGAVADQFLGTIVKRLQAWS